MSVHLARWEEILPLPDGPADPPGGSPSTWLLGADQGRHRSEFGSLLATEFIAIGIHASAASASACAVADVPQFADAVEVCSAVLEPTRSHGHLNWLERGCFESSGSRAVGPVAVLTSAGWEVGPDFDVDRALGFAAAVDRVRTSLWADAPDGLLSHQAFAFPGVLTHDGITFTTWRDEASMTSFAYRAGTHKTEMDAFRLDESADRTSFTRLRPLETHGTWWGVDPFAPT